MWSDADFLWALVSAPSFRAFLAAPVALLVVLLSLTILFAARSPRRPARAPLHRDERGLAVAADFVITLPLLMATVSMIVQFASLLHGATFVHYAAYAAARSARVHAWEEFLPLFPLFISDEVEARAERAARYVLIGAAPADPSLPLEQQRYQNARTEAEDYLRVLARGGASSAALARQAGYAFYPENAKVSVRILLPPGVPRETVRASVDFWLYCGPLYGRLLGEQRPDGLWSVPVHADMEVY